MFRETSRKTSGGDQRYTILGRLGEGGMGVVFEATDSKFHRPVALKFARCPASGLQASQRLAREAAAMALPHGSRTCSVYDLATCGGRPCLVMERLVGSTLEARLTEESLEASAVIRIAVQVTEALEAIHQVGLVHQDIKPANLFITTSGRVKVLDFGLATVFGDPSGGAATKRAGRSVMGTPNYVAPERLLKRPADFRSDLFSLGVVIYEMATGWPPFAADSPAEVIFKVLEANPASLRALAPARPVGLERIVMKLLARDPDNRYWSAADVKKALLGVDCPHPNARLQDRAPRLGRAVPVAAPSSRRQR